MTTEDKQLLLWMLQKAEEWEGSYLPDDVDIKGYLIAIDKARDLVNRLIDAQEKTNP